MAYRPLALKCLAAPSSRTIADTIMICNKRISSRL